MEFVEVECFVDDGGEYCDDEEVGDLGDCVVYG